MSRRSAPRPAGSAIRAARESAAPKTCLAATQAAWEGVLGAPLAARAQPVSERDGALLVECIDAGWAQELDLMQVALLERLHTTLGDLAPKSLRFRVNTSRF